MLRVCVNPSFELFLSPRGDRCEQSAPTVRQLLNHGYRFETLKRRLGFTAVPCQAMANLAGIDRFAKRTRSASPRQGIGVWVLKLGSLCADGVMAFCQPSPVGEGGTQSVTDEVSFINQPSPYSPLDLSLSPLVHFRHGENFLCEGRSGGALFHAPAPVSALLARCIHASA